MNVLAIGCHPDDLEIGCGGTLVKYKKLGHKVFMCHIANGNLGHAIIMPGELRSIRDKEAQKAAELIGAEYFSIDVGDLLVESTNKEIRLKLIEVIRYANPDILITQHIDDYMRDHVETSRFAFDASFAATIPHLLTDHQFIDKIPSMFYMDTLAGIGFIPTEYVDITDEIDQKLKAIACHESQIKWMLEHDHIDFLDMIKTGNKYRGIQCSIPYAEGFKQYAGWPRLKHYRMLP